MFPAPATRDGDFARSGAGIAALVRYAVTHGVPESAALAGTGLDDVPAPGAEVTARQELAVVRTLRSRLGEVGREVGETYTAASFGALGYALLAGPTVADAMATALRFIDLSFAFAIPSAELAGDVVRVRLDASSLPADVRRFLLERDVVAVHRVLDSLVPGGVGGTLAIDHDVHRATLVFPATELTRPLATRGEVARAAAEAACAATVDRRRARTGLARDVRVLIAQHLADGAPMGDVAAALAVTERTLRRRLAAAGTGYRELLDEVRSSLAAELLEGPATMPVAEVARRLGYADSAALGHARARWRAAGHRSVASL